MEYNQQEALSALELCVAWRRGDERAVLALSRGAVVNSMCWLRRLTETKKRRTFGAGEVEAMDYGLEQCGRDVTQIRRHVLAEKETPELLEMYYHAPRKTAAQRAPHRTGPAGAAAPPLSPHGLPGGWLSRLLAAPRTWDGPRSRGGGQ